MAKLNASCILSILVMASLSPHSHGLSINGLQIGSLLINGLLLCTLNANPNAPPVSGQTVFFKCAGSTTSLGQAVTDATGAFKVVVNTVDTLLFDPSSCGITVNLPVATCSVYPPDGVLTASIRLVNVLQTTTGNTANYITGNFVPSIVTP